MVYETYVANHWTVKVMNNECQEMANEIRTSYVTIEKRQTVFFGHIVERKTMKITIVTGKINGRLREMILSGL